MGQRPDNVTELSDTLTLCEYSSGGSKGFWLWDDTRKMNLAMRAKTEQVALLDVIDYYQKRLLTVENELSALRTKVDSFLEQFNEGEE